MNFKKNIVVFTILLCCMLFSISCVMASDANDTGMATCENQINDVNDELIAASQGDVISSSDEEAIAASREDLISASDKGTFTELQNLIDGALDGATITLEKDYSYDNEFNSTHGIVIAKNLTINGNGHTLNGLSKSRILFTLFGVEQNNKITLNNIVFKNGFTKFYGGAILNFADLTVNKCVFEKNYADTTAGAICSVGSLNCKNSNFNKNTANGSGGAIFSLNLDAKVQFMNNTDLKVIDYLVGMASLVDNISAYIDEFSAYVNNSDPIIVSHLKSMKSNVMNMSLNILSGDFNLGNLASYVVSMKNNIANMNSELKAIAAHVKNVNSELKYVDSYVKNMSAYLDKLSFNLNDIVSFVNENELISALLNDVSIKFGTDKISNCKFTNNVALGRAGGAIYAFSHINIDSSTFTSNKADQVGGAVYAAKNLNLKNSKFTKNKASIYGGAVYFRFHELSGSYDKNGNWKSTVKYYKGSIEKCVFTQNVAKNRGGAIYGFKYSKKPKLSAVNAVKCTFSDNQADTYNELYGGALKSCNLKNTITLKTVNVKKSAKKLVLTATLKNGKKLLKNKKVTFKFNGKTYKAKTNKKGVAKVTVTSSVLKKLRVGSTIYYQANYAKLHVKKLAKVNK